MIAPITIEIIKPKVFRWDCLFYKDGAPVGSLKKDGKWSSRKFIAAFGDRQWRFNLSGFWKPEMEITAEQSPYIKYKMAWGHNARLSFRSSDGFEYQFYRKGFWKQRWYWKDHADNILMEFHPSGFFSKATCYIHQPHKEFIYLLMLMGWCKVRMVQEAAAAAAG